MTLSTPPSAEVWQDTVNGQHFALVTAGADWLMSELEEKATEALIDVLERPARARLVDVGEFDDLYRATYIAAPVGARS